MLWFLLRLSLGACFGVLIAGLLAASAAAARAEEGR